MVKLHGRNGIGLGPEEISRGVELGHLVVEEIGRGVRCIGHRHRLWRVKV